MKENDVFWLGSRSRSGDQRQNFADEKEFAMAMRAACEAHGCTIQRFVSAKGVYGTWLLEFGRDGTNQRIVWNGKEEKLVLQVALAGSGWDEPKSTTVASIDIRGFSAGICELIGRDAGPVV
jgi:hypothetical protein